MTEKHPVTARKGTVVTNHPLASGAGGACLLARGNPVDALPAAGGRIALAGVRFMPEPGRR
ncbi:hypothetical protein D9599_07555 [Roseomonas sp. KE2513]|uniref:hypothetical protein n=1 Tax=Roseomonas sp. KE2513 TaxID=2479202 RepID=UPI0018E016AC|nr:hypothetical protein [Roseomonas sp. KE2513]MBI0535422.1 hypothetical protein [Roseomonas sp. KE2513]